MSEPHALVGAYALDAVDPYERAEFEEHLQGCDDCHADVRAFAATAARLSGPVAVPSPGHLRAAVLASVATTRPLPPAAPAGRHLAERPVAGRPRRWLAAAAAGIAAAVAVGALGIGTALDRSDDAPAPTATSPDPVVERVLEDADAERAAVRVGEASATVIRSATWKRAALVTQDMPAAPEGSHYALWMLTPDGTMVAAGTMPPGSDQTVLLEGDASTATAVGVTVEPDAEDRTSGTPDGERAPTSDPIVLIELG